MVSTHARQFSEATAVTVTEFFYDDDEPVITITDFCYDPDANDY